MTIDDTISHFKILHKLGAGGMGEVFLAEDTKLERKVAIKFLPAEVATDPDRLERFRREAQSAAGLQHPNVVSIFDRGEFGDTYFIAMEYVDGTTLKEIVYDIGGGLQTTGNSRPYRPAVRPADAF